MQTTIAAIATPVGNAGIGIVRISGSKALEIVSGIFSEELRPRYATLGTISVGDITDTVIAIYFQSPNSFTGEDVVEIQAHGGSMMLDKILSHLFHLGATPAASGEFSKRAFLNGKMTLSSAEAIIDLINADSDAELRAAASGHNGRLLDKLTQIENELITLAAQIEVVLDHPELDLIADTSALQPIITDLELLISTEQQGRLTANGVSIAVLGKPNVGKSSLFNAILGRDRAIVTNIAGTTTDTISESIQYGGYKFTFNDTAGLREGKSEIERLGIERSKKIIHDADICLVIFDGSERLTQEDHSLLELIGRSQTAPTLYVFNKSDLVGATCGRPSGFQGLPVSAKTGEGVEDIKQKIYDMVIGQPSTHTKDLVITNTRHMQNLKSAHVALLDAQTGAGAAPLHLDLIAIDVATARGHIGQISGTDVSESVIDEIFSRFCLGK